MKLNQNGNYPGYLKAKNEQLNAEKARLTKSITFWRYAPYWMWLPLTIIGAFLFYLAGLIGF